MKRHFYPLALPYLAILIFITSCSIAQEYSSCSTSYKCGDIDITYPFYGAENRPDYCGYPGFQVSCVSDVLRINISSLTYRVLGIDNSKKMVTVARDDYWGDYCVTYLFNTTLEGSNNIFKYGSTSQNQLSLYYNCPTAAAGLPAGILNQYSCNINATTKTGYFSANNDIGGAAVLMCNDSVKLPVFQNAFETLRNTPNLDNLKATIDGGFGLDWTANNNECDACDKSGGQCGRNLTSGEFICYCADNAPTCTRPITPTDQDSGLAIGIKLAIGLGVSSVSMLIIFLLICCLRKKNALDMASIFRQNDVDVDAFIRSYGSLTMIKHYKYSDVKKMTSSFKEKLGQGGYGCVYKGKLSDGQLVAVKVLSESKGNGEDFLNEVASISRTSHVNVVNLLGFCYGRTKRALIYEFMSSGSLDRFIYSERSPDANPCLEWGILFQIAVGVARGLEYLHSGCNTRILHFDIKPHNILLDEDFCPKISDFGLAKLCQRKESIISMTGMRGTAGYIAPEMFSRLFGGVSYKSDVYSYGMMLLEMARGERKAEVGLSQTSEIYFPHWVYKQLEPGMELKLDRIMTEEEEVIARKMILIGLWCIQTKPSDRPTMSKVVEMLEGNIQALQIPPKPVIYSPPRSPHHSSFLSSLS